MWTSFITQGSIRIVSRESGIATYVDGTVYVQNAGDGEEGGGGAFSLRTRSSSGEDQGRTPKARIPCIFWKAYSSL